MASDRDDLERIRQAVNLVELFEGVTTVRKVRGSFKALCPFHTEKTPSMSIDPVRGLYHCFGCGVGGDVFTFVQETQGLSFVEAMEVLADRAGIVIRRDPRAVRRRERRSRLVEAVAEAGRYYQERLKSADEAGHARSYVRGRKYGVEVVDQFELGYAPDRPDALISHLRGLGHKDSHILAAGLARRVGSGRLMDQMRGRLMFPIHNVRGEMVGFGGRLLRGDGPKYLNTPETPLYKKSELLYGLDKARSAISREELGVVVEGYTDVIAFHLAELPLAVATCGTALGEAHFDLLRRFSSRIVLAFDADAAGAGAAVRGDDLRITSELGLDLRVAIMPEGRDPADLVFDDKGDLLRQAVDGSAPITEFRLNRLLEQYNLGEREARTRAMREAAELIARHPDAAARYQHALYVAGRTHMSIDLVQSEIGRNAPPSRGGRSQGRQRDGGMPRRDPTHHNPVRCVPRDGSVGTGRASPPPGRDCGARPGEAGLVRTRSGRRPGSLVARGGKAPGQGSSGTAGRPQGSGHGGHGSPVSSNDHPAPAFRTCHVTSRGTGSTAPQGRTSGDIGRDRSKKRSGSPYPSPWRTDSVTEKRILRRLKE